MRIQYFKFAIEMSLAGVTVDCITSEPSKKKQNLPRLNRYYELYKNISSNLIFVLQIMIEGYHDVANQRIYLNLKSNKQKDIKFMQLLLFLFHVCHIIICYHPYSTLDQSYLRLFQTLDIARSKPGMN